MKKLIELDVAIDAVHRNYDTILDFRSDGETVANSVEDILSELPAVDAVPVVRCRDCEHKDHESGFCHGRGWPMQLVPDDGFCDRGARKGGQTS